MDRAAAADAVRRLVVDVQDRERRAEADVMLLLYGVRFAVTRKNRGDQSDALHCFPRAQDR